jgi:hypothetical protein
VVCELAGDGTASGHQSHRRGQYAADAMTATLQRFCRQLPANRQLKRMPLAECLKRLGLKPDNKKRAFNVAKANEWELSDLFNAAHALYRSMMAALHPDAGGSEKICARLTELWMRIKQLFKRKGITG